MNDVIHLFKFQRYIILFSWRNSVRLYLLQDSKLNFNLFNKHGESLEEKSLTICSGTDYININYQHVICPDAATAKVKKKQEKKSTKSVLLRDWDVELYLIFIRRKLCKNKNNFPMLFKSFISMRWEFFDLFFGKSLIYNNIDFAPTKMFMYMLCIFLAFKKITARLCITIIKHNKSQNHVENNIKYIARFGF